MAVTARIEPLPGYPQSRGGAIECIAKVTLSGTYQSSGFQVDQQQFGVDVDLVAAHIAFAEGSYEYNSYRRFAVWDPDVWFILHDIATGNETANGTDVTGDIYFIRVIGI
jgi:hypothetical protein